MAVADLLCHKDLLRNANEVCMVQEFFAPIAAAKADSWEGTGLEGGGEAMSAVLDLIRQHKVSDSFRWA